MCITHLTVKVIRLFTRYAKIRPIACCDFLLCYMFIYISLHFITIAHFITVAFKNKRIKLFTHYAKIRSIACSDFLLCFLNQLHFGNKSAIHNLCYNLKINTVLATVPPSHSLILAKKFTSKLNSWQKKI